ncbi:DUF4139 domain-containing protein [Mariniradius sediminis]|uniref:Mucoidy inhibitor MuiA family protein n=1 Tax=Mariniradius sediminis TaxID=2909237 RepID=A0ABS9BY27_9BACT|nr:mucoidy inhibitor MuiA family protein [Mariniradius sediminis]MCF1752964.1 mucoidy inhibitor MuiA family protein [Mariniradius sediminis]
MKPKTFSFLILLAIGYHFDAQATEKELKTNIQQVTIFSNGAQIFENGSVQVDAGETTLIIKGKSPYMDEKSLQVKSTGALTILSVNHRSNYLEKKLVSQNDSLVTLLEKENLNLDKLVAEQDVLKEKMALLQNNKNLGGANIGLSMTALKQALDFFEKEISAIKSEEINNRRKQQETRLKIQRLEKQINDFQSEPITPVSEVWIKVSAQRAGTANFAVSYLVSGAGWFPKYDIRAINIQKPIQIQYKAEIWQNTGNDWKNVKIKLSNAQPNKNSSLPELQKWNLTYARNTIVSSGALNKVDGVVSGIVTDSNGEPLPGVTVLVKGTTIGTSTDINGRYSITLPNGANRLVYSFVGLMPVDMAVESNQMNIRMEDDVRNLSEVVVMGYSSDRLQGRAPGVSISTPKTRKTEDAYEPLETVIRENQTTVEIEVEKPYTLLTNGEKLLVDLKTMELPASYEYFAVPKLDPSAFLIAQVTDWEQLNLLPGEANLYFEETFIGKTILDPVAFQDTLSISLGRDQGINIKREKVAQFSTKRNVGSNVNESRAYQIQVRNSKSLPVKLTITDQIPVSVVSDITVSATELSGASKDDEKGFLTWKMELPAQGQKTLEFRYDVRYPRREKVILD